jgi:hypothetical protein
MIPARGKAQKNALASDDIDDMLAEFRAQDLQDGDKITSSSSNNESNSSSSSRNINITTASGRANNATTARTGSSEEVSKEFTIAV